MRERPAWSTGREIGLTAAYILGAFLVVAAVLVLALPRGAALRDIYGPWTRSDGAAARGPSSASFAPPGAAPNESEAVATLTRVVRKVSNRPARAVAWAEARPGMAVEDDHAIQTASHSAATISFADHSTLELDENSLVVVKRPARQRNGQARASLVVLGGRVRGHAGPSAPAMGIVTPGGTTEFRSTGDNPADYSVVVNADRSATVSVYSGVASISAGGKTAVVQSSESITLFPDRSPGTVERIPDAPRPIAPADGAELVYAAAPPQLRFEWSAAAGARSYRVEIARDPGFEEPLYETGLEGTSTTYGRLEQGHYYWRVQSLNGGAEGARSPSSSVIVRRDADPPTLQVELPADAVLADHFLLRGTTEPGTSVLIGSLRVPVLPGGGFEHELSLRRGPNLVVIEAVDDAGNVTYHSGYVHAKF